MTNYLSRYEFKYIIPQFILPKIENDIVCFGFTRDKTNNDNYYIVSSVYFDTPILTDYLDTVGGFLKRKKIRARMYGDYNTPHNSNSPVWLEIKEKYDMLTWKKRVCINHNDWNLLLFSPNEFIQNAIKRFTRKEYDILENFVFWLTYERRRPYINIRYKRKAFECFIKEERIRITLDYEIKAQSTEKLMAYVATDVDKDMAVMEVKFLKQLPEQIKFILTKYNLRRDAYSKYENGIKAIRHFYPIPG